MCTGAEIPAAAAATAATTATTGAKLAAMAPYLMAASAAMQGIGLLNNMNAAKQQRAALDAAHAAEMMRQREFADRRVAELNQIVPQHTTDRHNEMVADQTAARAVMLAPALDQIGTMQTYNDAAPSEVKSDLANAMLSALNKGKNYAQTLAKLGSYDAVRQNQGIALGRAAQQLGLIDSAAANSQGIYTGTEIPQAQRAGDRSRLNADIFSGLGSIGMLYANGLKAPQNFAPVTTSVPRPVG